VTVSPLSPVAVPPRTCGVVQPGWMPSLAGVTGFEPATDAVLETAALPVELHPSDGVRDWVLIRQEPPGDLWSGAARCSEAGDPLMHGPPTIFSCRLALVVIGPQRDRLAEAIPDVRGHADSRVRGASPGLELLREHPRHGRRSPFGSLVRCRVRLPVLASTCRAVFLFPHR
jgi:hypothetical protein